MFDVWGRPAETGSGNNLPLVPFESTPLEQLGDMLIFCKGLRLLFNGTAFFPLTLAVFDVCGRLASQKPEMGISRRWWRLRALRWNNLPHVV